MADMRQYAERLSRAMPERFKLKSNLLRDAENMPPGTHWTDFSAYVHELRMDLADVSRWWAFWGPLATEFGIEKINNECTVCSGTAWIDQGDMSEPCHHCDDGRHHDLLISVAEAVCQEAERKENAK